MFLKTTSTDRETTLRSTLRSCVLASDAGARRPRLRACKGERPSVREMTGRRPGLHGHRQSGLTTITRKGPQVIGPSSRSELTRGRGRGPRRRGGVAASRDRVSDAALCPVRLAAAVGAHGVDLAVAVAVAHEGHLSPVRRPCREAVEARPERQPGLVTAVGADRVDVVEVELLDRAAVEGDQPAVGRPVRKLVTPARRT